MSAPSMIMLAMITYSRNARCVMIRSERFQGGWSTLRLPYLVDAVCVLAAPRCLPTALESNPEERRDHPDRDGDSKERGDTAILAWRQGL